jgi:hypothetical protein
MVVMSFEQDKISAVTKIQAATRGFFSRYRFPHLALTDYTDFSVNVVGNDPLSSFSRQHASHERIALIGTSGLRTLELACQLGAHAVKIFLIDNSSNVIYFWRCLQHMMRDASDQRIVEEQFMLLDIDENSRQEGINYLKNLCDRYTFNRIRRFISCATIIPQHWEDEETFRMIRYRLHVHSYQSIYVYPSNIVAWIHWKKGEKDARRILNNIQQLNPDVAMHTDLVLKKDYVPQNTYFFYKNNHDIDHVFMTIMSTSRLRDDEHQAREICAPVQKCHTGAVYITTMTESSLSDDEDTGVFESILSTNNENFRIQIKR